MWKRRKYLTTFLYCYTVWVDLVMPCLATFGGLNVPVVATTLGKVRGSVEHSRLQRRYYQYLGIPYAYPPVGDLRFEAPVPLEPWEGVRDATEFGSPCLQFDAILRGRVMGKEDCLFLNIFTPQVRPRKSYPVMVWVHGGGFVAGSSDMYSPKYIMDHDVVVVSMNYRLASLGFLNTGDDLIRGNMGLKDQNLVLRFVRDNIASFGGDPERITLFGESAGAAAVHYHVISPLSKGLFQGAIMQSGSIFCPWAHTRSPQKQALRFGAAVGCPTENTTVLVDCLKNMDGKVIVKQHASILSPIHTQDDFFPGSVEAVIRPDTFLHDNPFMLIKRGEFSRVPVIFGMNSGEGALKTARLEATPDVLSSLDTKWDDHVAILLHFNPDRKNVSSKVRKYYCPQSLHPITNDTSRSSGESTKILNNRVPPQEALENVTHMLSDGIWFQATKEAAIHHAKYAPVYLNYFSYHSRVLPSTYTFIKSAKVRNLPAELTWPKYFAEAYIHQLFFQGKNPKRFGACHGDDLLYCWSHSPILQIRPLSLDYPFSKAYVQSLVDFISDGRDIKFWGVPWEPVNNDTNNLLYMKLDKNPEMIEQPHRDRIEFIESLDIRDPLDPNNW